MLKFTTHVMETTNNTSSNIRKIKYFLSSVGLGVSTYLSYVKLFSNELFCGNSGCEIVQNSKYSELFGIPVAVLGMFFYVTLILLIFTNKKKLEKIWLAWGALFSTFLMYTALFVIGVLCTWCAVSFTMVVLISILTLAENITKSAKIIA